jgi:transposase
VFEDCLENSYTRTANMNHLTYECAKGIYERIADICIQHLLSLNEEIEILGIDEISIKKGHKDFQAVVSNVGKGYVIEVLKDRKKETVVEYLQSLPVEAKQRIVFVSMDMWTGYFSAARQEIPDTTIVIDRFHVMNNLNKAITSCRRNIQKRMPKEVKEKYKHYRWTILKNEDKMNEEDMERLDRMKQDCPELEQLYNLKTQFQAIFDHTRKVERADRKLKIWEKKVRKLDDDDMNIFLTTLSNWREWILNYFVSNKVTNGFVEGMNNKIKLIKRVGYGYRNKMNFRRRVLVECGYNNLSKSKKLIFLR